MLKLGSYWVWIGFGLGLDRVWIGFGLGSDWVWIFCVFLDRSHCKSLSYQVLQVVGSVGNWVRFAYKGYKCQREILVRLRRERKVKREGESVKGKRVKC